MLPPRPSTADISTYLSYHALHQLSGREYHEWVQAQADGGAAWAVEMLHSAQVWPKPSNLNFSDSFVQKCALDRETA